MKKQIMDLEVLNLEQLNERNVLLNLHCPIDGEILAGQFVEVRIDNQTDVFLRRPISVHYYSEESHELWLLVQLVGKGTRAISMLEKGTKINLV
ncbi:MAG: dihydroorotate dehydrogenase electron transfer subunit, partial [Paludibacteraceae bacterium]|nr:dihydroorotate dehydrogenase electron transfer subunit [Paludibacteraceae bacterium]